jgi:hypothetical protein
LWKSKSIRKKIRSKGKDAFCRTLNVGCIIVVALLAPGQSTKVPVAGYKTSDADYVHKLTNGYNTCTVNQNYIPTTNFSNPAYWLIYLGRGGDKLIESFQRYLHERRDNTWDSLFNK